MKKLVIKRQGLPLGEAFAIRPFMTIGRSPICDILLRSPGVQPVHFLLEWVGTGGFDPNRGSWNISDISALGEIDEKKAFDHGFGAGTLVTGDPIEVSGYSFLLTDDNISETPLLGGALSQSVDSKEMGERKFFGRDGNFLLEAVRAREDSRAVQEVVHLEKPGLFKKVRPFQKVSDFQVEWNQVGSQSFLKVLLTELPGAKVFSRGRPLDRISDHKIGPGDFLRVHWRKEIFYLRLVQKLKIPTVQRSLFRDPLVYFFVASILLLLGIHQVLKRGEDPRDQQKVVRPIRVAKVEVKKDPPKPLPPTPVQKRSSQPKKKPDPKPSIPKAKEVSPRPLAPVSRNVPPTRKSSPVVKKQKQVKAKPRKNPAPELNQVAKKRNVNQLGVLGALGKPREKQKAQVRADQVLNSGVVRDTVSGEKGSFSLKSSPEGSLGKISQRGSTEITGPDLAAAATRRRSGDSYDLESQGRIQGGSKSNSFQSSGQLSGSSGRELGTLQAGQVVVKGGLDRETVRRVVAAHRRLIRRCYERGLVPNPKLAGRLSYRWIISGSGPVISSQLRSSTAKAPSFEGCVKSVIQRMRFPAAENGQSTTVLYPFIFQSNR